MQRRAVRDERVLEMSTFTDVEHTFAKKATQDWRDRTPGTPEEAYAYADFQYRLKDFCLAAQWYGRAAAEGYVPAQYMLGLCIATRRGIRGRQSEATTLFKHAVAYYKEHLEDPEACYRLGILYLYGYGVEQDAARAREWFQKGAEAGHAGALYELGKFYRDGKAGCPLDKQEARAYFRKAYDGHWEQAIFADFALFDGPFEAYEYKREIKEAYSFRLGQLMRVAEARPDRETLKAIIALYRHGYPGDTGERKQAFIRKGDKFVKRLETLPDKGE